ncbi:unnamed protein product [Meganyctiphanes norvegica]|uniref:Oplophorus-luciferin 2-monooxygenase non-catalytic subunit n=1 Tax=Meganyctiphanes norvegica TaxID=48144 RepID=A0AAV2RF72_MEGNR
MVRTMYLVVWILLQQSLLFVDSIGINTKVSHPLPNADVFAEHDLALPSSVYKRGITEVKTRTRNGVCPTSEDIAPCTCSVSEDNAVTMDCSDVTSEDQLREIFTSNFPVSQLYMFTTFHSPLIVLESGVFGEVNFNHIKMNYGNLTEVELGALDGMYDTLEELRFSDNHILNFPFETIESFTKLKHLAIDNNNEYMTNFPVIKSDSLIDLRLMNWKFDFVPKDAFKSVPKIEEIILYGNNISSFELGTFSNLNHLKSLDLCLNGLTHIPKGLFSLSDGLSNITWIRLSANQIDTIEPNAFNVVANVSIELDDNHLATIDEEVWGPLFDEGFQLHIRNNPLLCGCDIAWLVRNGDYLSQIHFDATCYDGVFVSNLKPGMFDDC